jgi:hypothetical protein
LQIHRCERDACPRHHRPCHSTGLARMWWPWLACCAIASVARTRDPHRPARERDEDRRAERNQPAGSAPRLPTTSLIDGHRLRRVLEDPAEAIPDLDSRRCVIACPARCPLTSNLLSGTGKCVVLLLRGMVSVLMPDVASDDRPRHAGTAEKACARRLINRAAA